MVDTPGHLIDFAPLRGRLAIRKRPTGHRPLARRLATSIVKLVDASGHLIDFAPV